MDNMAISLLIIVGFVGFIFYYSQQKFRNKMLCYFLRPNKLEIEQWVPMETKYVVFDGGKYAQGSAFKGKNLGRYYINPKCIVMKWYTGGFNRFFPVFVPTLRFRWDTPYPYNPETFEVTWLTPEAQQAGWEEHQHVSFSRAAAIVGGAKKASMIERLLPIVAIGVSLIILYLVWKGISGLDYRMFLLEQQIKVLMP